MNRRRLSVPAQIALFVMTLAAIAALYFFCDQMHWSTRWIPLITSLAVAEWLIRRYGFWRTGVENALWIGGLCAFIFSLPSSGKPEAILTFVAAFAISGWRLRNEWFGAVAVVVAVVYLGVKGWQTAALLVGLTLSVAAAVLSSRMFFGILAIALPIAAYAEHSFDAGSQIQVVLLFLVVAAVDLALGIYFRIIGPLLASLICITIAVVEAHEFIPMSLEAELIVGGALTLAVAATLLRVLRGRTIGIVVTPVKKSESADAMQLAGVLSVAAGVGGTSQAEGAHVKEGGGEFGGAGASGQY